MAETELQGLLEKARLRKARIQDGKEEAHKDDDAVSVPSSASAPKDASAGGF